ncbi:MAG: restriction endonuclease subunit S [Actinomycetota bacterium]
MILGLKPYPEMKDSGAPWLGEVPKHWEVLRLGALLRERGETNVGGLVTDVLSVMKDRGVIPYAEKGNVGNKKSDDITRYKIVRPNDIVVNCMNVIIGSVGLSKYTGCLSPVYYVLTRRSDSDEPRYLNAYFQTKSFQLSLVRIGNGILAHRMRIPMELLKCEPFPKPPAVEQTAIARFVEHFDRRIRRFIHAKQKLIKLLEEQEQTTLHRVVTRGLDADIRLKPSGADWLGDVPEHWDLVRTGSVLKLKKQLVGDASDQFTLLSLTKRGVIPRDLENPEGKFPSSFDTYQSVEVGDLIFCLFDIDETPRAVGIATMPGMVTGAYTRFTTMDPSTIDYVYLYFLAMDNGKRLKPLYTGLRKVITKSSFLSALMPLPPPDERSAIVEHIRASKSQTDATIAHAEREISLLLEYRTRLIADVVTGKLDVREAVKHLPAETDESDALADTIDETIAEVENDEPEETEEELI